jgi:hypothetical protein
MARSYTRGTIRMIVRNEFHLGRKGEKKEDQTTNFVF